MSSVMNIVSDGRGALFSLRKLQRPDPFAQPETLRDKLEAAGDKLNNPRSQLAGMNVARTALEEARSIGGPKAAAEERMERAEARVRELRMLARLYAARGDRDKLAMLAREAASIAREVGKAAGDFSIGMSAQTARDEANGGLSLQSVSTTTTTTLSVASTEATASADRVAVDDGGVTIESDASALQATAIQATTETTTTVTLGVGSTAARDALKTGGLTPVNLMSARVAAWRGRHEEAEAFLRRGRAVLTLVKSIIVEAKRAAEEDPDARARVERKKDLEEDEKSIVDANEAFKGVSAAVNGDGSPLAATGGVPASISVAAGVDTTA